MNDSDRFQVEVQRKQVKPLEMTSPLFPMIPELVKRFYVLIQVFVGSRPELPVRLFRSLPVEADRIVFVISHYGERRARFNHASNDPDGFADTGSAIYEVSDEYGGSLRMGKRSAGLGVPHTLEQRLQGECMTVKIADDVVAHAPDSFRDARPASSR